MKDFVSYQRSGEVWFNTDPELKGSVEMTTPLIAPMQSFIVVANGANPNIVAQAKATTASTATGVALRSATLP
jgi:hypothetical protein